VPYAQEQAVWRRSIDVAVRVDGQPLAAAGALRAVLRRVDPDVPLARISSMGQVIAASMADRRFNLFILGGFAVLALALAAAGTYGVMAYTVVQRTREIGVRVALGATPRHVLAMVLGDGMLVSVAGVAAGAAIALVASSALADMLFGITRTDVTTFISAAIVLLAVSAIASYVPARRALRVDPLLALRSE
jgi:putative ABC transport system permease protein